MFCLHRAWNPGGIISQALYCPLIIIYVRSRKLIIPSGFINPNNDPAAVHYPELIIPSSLISPKNDPAAVNYPE